MTIEFGRHAHIRNTIINNHSVCQFNIFEFNLKQVMMRIRRNIHIAI